MATLLDSIPATTAKKVGKALFTEHKDKIERVVAASKATEKELRDPEKLREWLGVPASGSSGSKTVELSVAKKKLSLTVTLIDYNGLKKALDKSNKWLASLAAYNPMPEVAKRKKTAEATFIAYGKSVARVGVSDPATEKLATKAFGPIAKLKGEVADLTGYFSACKSVFPKHRKIYQTYVDIFESARKVFSRIINEIPLPPAIQAELMDHHNNCEQLRSRCQRARDHCKSIATKFTAHHKKTKGYGTLFDIWLGQLGDTLVPATVRSIASKVKPEVKSYLASFNKLFGM